LVTEAEIHKVVDFIKHQATPQYVLSLLESPDEDGSEEGFDDDLSDELYDQAVQLVTDSGQASISWVQRRLRVGYNRAARMIERMEREGVISTSESGRPREVLAQRIDVD
jgi:S-DNA-T family DNA segregation ATPase FtsK/SpoIIIE